MLGLSANLELRDRVAPDVFLGEGWERHVQASSQLVERRQPGVAAILSGE